MFQPRLQPPVPEAVTELRCHAARALVVAGGPFTEQKYSCADAGGQQYSAWIYRESDGRYHRLLLHLRGDISQANRSDAARELFHWLEDVTGTASSFGCDAFPD